MTKQITRYGGTIHEAGLDTRYEFGPKADGEYVKYDDIKHLLQDEPTAEARIAPWRDFQGGMIREGDEIAHPDGQHGKVMFLSEFAEPIDQWRVDYCDGGLSRLCLQIGDKGQAVVAVNRT